MITIAHPEQSSGELMTHGKTYNKSPRRINHKATRSKTNTGTSALERSVEQTTAGGGGGGGGGGFKAFLQLTKFHPESRCYSLYINT